MTTPLNLTSRAPGDSPSPRPSADPAPRTRRRASCGAFAAALVAGLAWPSPARADSWLVFDDESGFGGALVSGASSTVVDSGGAFSADPAAGLVASVVRSGTVAGEPFSFTVYDVNFSNVPTGTITPGSAGGDVASSSQITVETPVSQGTVTGGGTFGYDSIGSTDSTTSRNALLVDFTTTPGGLGIGHFALWLVDFEASLGGIPGALRLYDDGVLVFSHSFAFPGTGGGNNELHFLGVVAADASSFFDQVVVVVGDDTAGGTGNSETWAADRFQFGVAHNPEPGTWALFGLGAGALAAIVRRRRSRRAADEPPAAGRGAPG